MGRAPVRGIHAPARSRLQRRGRVRVLQFLPRHRGAIIEFLTRLGALDEAIENPHFDIEQRGPRYGRNRALLAESPTSGDDCSAPIPRPSSST